MKLTITLSQKEYDDINGWVQYLRANPQYIGVGGRYPGSGPVQLQTRIVLDDQSRARFDEISAQFPTAAPAPTPTQDPPGVLGRFDAAPSNWAAWKFITSAEILAMEQRYPNQWANIHEHVNFYESYMSVPGSRHSDGTYWFQKLVPIPFGNTLVETLDINGAADEYIAALCAAQGRPVLGYLR